MNDEPIPASDPAVKKVKWIYQEDAPSGWFLITAVWRSAVPNGKDIHMAVNGRGPRYLLDFHPDDKISIRPSGEG